LLDKYRIGFLNRIIKLSGRKYLIIITNKTLTKAICNKGFSGNSSILPRSNFGVGGKEICPQSLLHIASTVRRNNKQTMAVPEYSVTIYDKDGNIHKISDLVDKLKNDKDRVLIDDDIGTSIDISDLDFYVYSFDLEKKENKKAKISTLHHRKKKVKILRITLGNGVAVDVSEDTLFHVQDNDGQLKYVRADQLKEGMAVLTGINENGTGIIVY
jgi:hypothetical protein